MEHYYQTIPGWFFHEALFRRLIEEAPENSRFVEVGSWKGRSASFIGVEMIRADKGLHLFCVDHFEGSDEEIHRTDRDVINGTLYETFLKNTEPVSGVVTVIVGSSEKAARLVDDETKFVVYLDASHDYDSVLKDIKAWWPKVQSGGRLIGDDWAWPGVRKAVREFFQADILLSAQHPRLPAWYVHKV